MVRNLSLVVASVACLLLAPPGAPASDDLPKHTALSLIGEPEYGPDFKHFKWVNPNAPKGGRVRQMVFGSFDSLNIFGKKGRPAAFSGILYDTLMSTSPDEPSTSYGLIAEWVSFPADFSSARFRLRKEARFHDGKPITPEDVIFSLQTLKIVSENYKGYYKNVVTAEKTGEHEVTFTFDVKGNRELPLILGQLPVLPKHYWTGTDSKGEPRDLAKSTFDPPMGSGPYRIKDFIAGRSIAYERVKDWWAKDLPVAKGQWNFDEIVAEYFLNADAGFLAFQAGQLDYRAESSAADWATKYDFDAATRGLVKKHKLPVAGVWPMQTYAFNIRRPQFKDARVRRAFNHAMNFEHANKQLFHGEYSRVASFFDGSELKAEGLPSGRELKFLEEVRGQVPPEVFTQEWKNPVNSSPQEARRNLEIAIKLLTEAGFRPKNGVQTNAAGIQLTAEFLLRDPRWERIVLPYIQDLNKLGIKASVRTVDTSQYERRVDSFDFDIIVEGFRQSLSPGNEQRDFWGSRAADMHRSRNVIGIKNPAVDKLIDRIILAEDRATLVAATRALDRVLLWNHYVVPQWHLPFERIAMWDRYGRPETLPRHSASFLRVWWWDEAADRRIAKGGG